MQNSGRDRGGTRHVRNRMLWIYLQKCRITAKLGLRQARGELCAPGVFAETKNNRKE